MGVYLGVGKTVDDYSAMQGPCATGFHVPTSSERSAVRTAGINMGAWTSSGSTSITNIKNYLKIPLPGSRSGDSGSYNGMGNSFGEYWTCTRASYGNAALRFFIRNDSSFKEIFAPSFAMKSDGLSIRPFKDVPVVPDSNRTVLYQGTGTAGIYRNSTLGLISISSDGTTRYTIADKNLGATTVYSNGASLSEANCGKFYQRGNNYGFPYSGSITTSSTQVNAQNYGPGNYYSSSTFIYRTTSPYGWDSSDNNNLRGGVTGVQPKTVYPELKNAYIGEYVEPGIYHNATLGLISLSSDGSNWITIQDKNLGATQVWNSGDTLSQANAGKYYQWGNNYGFPFTGSVTTSSTQVDASNYGPGNYYSSSTFIKYNGRWDSTDNGNLWGGVTGTNEAMQGPAPDGFHVPLNTEWQTVHNVRTALGGGSSGGTNFGIALKLPFAGYRDCASAGVGNQSTSGFYWSSSRSNALNAYRLYFRSNGIYPQQDTYRAYGQSIRPFKNEAVQPDSSRTKLY